MGLLKRLLRLVGIRTYELCWDCGYMKKAALEVGFVGQARHYVCADCRWKWLA